jgi:hypothetical protein
VNRLLLLAVVAVLAGCGSSGDDGSGQAADWPGPPKANANGSVEFAGFNEFLAGDGKEFAKSPITAVTEFLALDETSAAVTTLRATSPGEVRNFSEVSATLDGLLDDSVRAARYTVEMQRNDANEWRVRAVDWAQQCQQGRGHQEFSPQPCV